MSLTFEEVEKIASLARLALADTEKEQYREQLSAVLDYAAILNELDVTAVPPTASAVALSSIMRDDVVEPSLSIEEVLYNVPQQAQNQFKIQSVLDE